MSKLGDEPAYPVPLDDFQDASTHPMTGLTKREYCANGGAPSLPYVTDEELWFHFRNNSTDVLEAMRQYDAFLVQRDVRYADALLAELAKENDDE